MITQGAKVGNYEIRSMLGEGGMGIVWMAEHPLIGRRVAIKVIHPNYASNPEAVSRFFTEAQSVNKIGHPNIVDITDFGKSPEGESYFVMEFLSGESLGTRIKKGRMPLDEAVYIAAQVADALAASHAHGILHRDLKPDNIFLIERGADHNFVKVLDFGLAKLTTAEDASASQHKTRAGSVMGTPSYMAPEQCMGSSNLDGRADIYAVGIILFELATGRLPFTGEGYGEIIVKHMTAPPPRAREIDPNLPEWIDELIHLALIKNPTNRLGTMAEFRDTLIAYLPTIQSSGGAGSVVPWQGRSSVVTPAPGMVQAMRSRPGLSHHGTSVPPARPSTLGGAAGASQASSPPRGGRGILIGGAVLGVLLGGGAIGFILLNKNKGETPPVAKQVEPEPPPVAPPPPDAAPLAVPSPPDAGPKTVEIVVVSDPVGADVTLDGTLLGQTPIVWRPVLGDKPLVLVFNKDGFAEQKKSIAPKANDKLSVKLKKKRTGSTTTDPTGPSLIED